MKKLISIKSDESGEHIYFTHKNGVDAIRKDDVVDIELLNPIKIKKKLTDLMANFRFLLIFNTTIAFKILLFIWDYAFSAFFISFLVLIYSLALDRRNSRDILKIYSKKGIIKYKINNDKIFKELYLHFKKEITKYFPKKDEMIFYTKNPQLHDVLYFGTKIFLVLLFLSFALMILKAIMPYNYFFINLEWSMILGMSIGSFLSWVFYYTEKNENKNIDFVIFEGASIEIHSSNFGLLRSRDTSWISNKYNLSDVLFKEDKGKVSICFWDQPNDDYENLIFSEEYRDITPIMMEYLNDLSEEQIQSN